MEKHEIMQKNGTTLVTINNLEQGQLLDIKKQYGINIEMLQYCIDGSERARIELDESNTAWLLIYKVISHSEDKSVVPLPIVVKGNFTFVFTNTDTAYINSYFTDLRNNKDDDETDNLDSSRSQWVIIFDILYRCTIDYFDQIELDNKERQRLESAMREKPQNQQIFELADLSKNLVYVLSSANANVIMLESAKMYSRRFNSLVQFNDFEEERLNDVLVEARQVEQMAQIASDIVDKVSGTFNNLLNNNLNSVMKFLTIYSVVLTIPTIVTGFYGMNVDLPFSHTPFSWVITILITIILSGLVYWQLKKNNML